MTADDHIARNRASRERLAAIIARLGARPVVLHGGWTAATALGHLAFWDRINVARLEKHLRDRQPIAFATDAITDYTNAAGLPQWTKMPLRDAAADATEAAAAVDALIERLPDDVMEAIRALGRPFLLDRSRHRTEHLDQIERALG